MLHLVADDVAPHAGAAAMDGADEGADGLDGALAEEAGGAPVSDKEVACVPSEWIFSQIYSPALASSRSRPDISRNYRP